jgi:hypothetical protein
MQPRDARVFAHEIVGVAIPGCLSGRFSVTWEKITLIHFHGNIAMANALIPLPPEAIGTQRGWQMLFDAIHDPAYSTDPNTQIDGFGMWIKGTRLNDYRAEHNPPYPPSLNHGWDWHDAETELRQQGLILKFSLPNRQVFFVLPQCRIEFEIQYLEATVVA